MGGASLHSEQGTAPRAPRYGDPLKAKGVTFVTPFGVCRDVGEIIPSPGGKGDREAVDEERRPLQTTDLSHFFGIRPNVVP